ncbi:hypothetical protein FQN60_016580 [Etheostoma spectabile]|uniref:Ubiquinol-cytochrome C reductase hinge domain-containing protein n=1 Tax=Etheostoma spectabile TaxID=54343 RepID=A0A5J5CYY9_9PERO|nr:hypothetical protein FQN60_016580 [Etheostoma spectabile]
MPCDRFFGPSSPTGNFRAVIMVFERKMITYDDPEEEEENAEEEEEEEEEQDMVVCMFFISLINSLYEDTLNAFSEIYNNVKDPLEIIRAKCEQTEHCVHTKELLEKCEERVGSRSSTTEECTEELFDFLHARDHCVSGAQAVPPSEITGLLSSLYLQL